MIKEAIEKILGLKKPEYFVTEQGRTFVDPSFKELGAEHSVNAFTVNTLTGVIDYIKSEFDTKRELLIHIISPTEISVFDALNATNDRRVYLKSEALLPRIVFGQPIEREAFQIALQANFCSNNDKKELLAIISNMTIQEGATVKDNGITQEVTVKQGVELSIIDLKERYELMPYRTFIEVAQPSSEFIFRVKEAGNTIYCSLHEADGGAWELNAMHSIKAYLEENLKEKIEAKQITIVC